MDSNLPVARRTRSRVAEFFRKKHEEIKRHKSRGQKTASGSSDSVGRSGLKGKSSTGFSGKLNEDDRDHLVALDDSEDDVVVEYEVDRAEDMEGKESILISSDDEDGGEWRETKGFSFGPANNEAKEDQNDNNVNLVGQEHEDLGASSSGIRIVDADDGGDNDCEDGFDLTSIFPSEEDEDDPDDEDADDLDNEDDELDTDDEDYEVSGSSSSFEESSGDQEEDDWVDEEQSEVFERKKRKKPETVPLHVDDDASEHADEVHGEKPRKKRRSRLFEEHEFVKILADSILDKAEVPWEDEHEHVAVTRPTLPLKFTLYTEWPVPPSEKSAEEKEEELWNEMAMCLALSENNVNDDNMVENETHTPPEDGELNRAALCRKGKHELILDEEIGFICKYCFCVVQEIKYCVPPFGKNPWGKSGRREAFTTDDNVFSDLHQQDSGCNRKGRCDSPTNVRSTVWDLIPGVEKSLYSHQREGFEFLWKNIAGDIYLDKLKELEYSNGESSGTGRGCILSHAPGTGKTRLTLVFLQSYLELYPAGRPVIIAPRNLLLMWEAEFKRWGIDIPFHNLNKEELSGKESKVAMNFLEKHVKSISRNRQANRWAKLYSWTRDKSILGISYGLLIKFFGAETKKTKKQNQVEEHQDEASRARKVLIECSGLLVLDEGHTPRNDHSVIFNAFKKFHTEKRIILSGTPFQNNFKELFNTLSLVRPKFADRISSKYGRGRKKNEARSTWDDLTGPIGKDDRLEAERLEEVKKIIAPFVHVEKGDILKEKLPGLRDSVIVLEPTSLQKDLLDSLEGIKGSFLNYEHFISIASVHPSLLLSKEGLEKGCGGVDPIKLERVRLSIEAGVKTRFLRELIKLSDARKERVIIFSQYLDPLELISEQLQSNLQWAPGREILYMHGTLTAELRQALLKQFNNKHSDSKVMLASTRACSEGISLIGGSRVVLLDVEWNPSVERQAISRAYRLGQEKVVYVYHLITAGTPEEKKYRRQVGKERVSELVFSANSAGGGRKLSANISDDNRDKILEELVEQEKLKDMFKKVIYQPKDCLVESFWFGGSLETVLGKI